MNTNVSVKDANAELVEQIIAKGDFSKLTVDQRNQYYAEVCRSAGLNPLTQPFAWIVLNNKLVLYALKNATDQLRTIHRVSVVEMRPENIDGVYVVTTKVANGEGRSDIATGAVPVANLKGDALANAMMKAETKSKRRATLSLCGLGFLDETEVETIPNAHPVSSPPQATTPLSTGPAVAPTTGSTPAPSPTGSVDPSIDPETGEVGPRTLKLGEKPDGDKDWVGYGKMLLTCVETAESIVEVVKWMDANDPAMREMAKVAPGLHTKVWNAVNKYMDELKGKEPWAAPPSS